MKIYTLYYTDTELYNKQVFILPNDAAAKKAMKLNLMNPEAISFKNEAILGNTILKSLGTFTEENGLISMMTETICNLKDLIDEQDGTLEDIK